MVFMGVVQYSWRVWGTHEKIRLIKMCLNESCFKVHEDKHLFDMFPIQNGIKEGDSLLPLLFNFALEYSIRRV
jgi:hypothetical protein